MAGVDLLVRDRPRVDDERTDPPIVRELAHPIDAVAGVPVGVEQREVDRTLRVLVDVELHHAEAIAKRIEHLREAAQHDLVVVDQRDLLQPAHPAWCRHLPLFSMLRTRPPVELVH